MRPRAVGASVPRRCATGTPGPRRRLRVLAGQVVPQPGPQALCDDQRPVGVQASQHLPIAGHLEVVAAALQVAQFDQDRADLIELPRDGVGATLHPAGKIVVLPLQLPGALGPARVKFPVVTSVTGMLAQPCARSRWMATSLPLSRTRGDLTWV